MQVLRLLIRSVLFLAFWVLVCAGLPTFAQHGAGHASGGHVSAPHAAPPAVHVPSSRPMVNYPPAGGGNRSFVVTPPPVRLALPPGANHPVIGNHVVMPPVLPPVTGPHTVEVGPHTTVGFPRTGMMDGEPLRFSPVMSFSGEGRQIWQDAAVDRRVVNNPGFRRPPHTPPFPLQPRGRGFPGGPNRPIFPGGPNRPIFPIFGQPGFGFYGSPFFGLGLGYGFGSLWWPSCGPYWGWGYGCNGLSYSDGYGYDGGYGYGGGYEFGSGGGNSPADVEAQLENQRGPEMYEPPSATSTIFVYGEENRELPQLVLRDGTVYNATDYWLVNDQLHCTTIEGKRQVEHVFDFAQLDLQKTIDVNMARGFRFVLRNEPMGQYLQEHPDGGGASGPQAPGVAAPNTPPSPLTPNRPGEPVAPPRP